MIMTWLQNFLCVIVVFEIPLIKTNQLLVETMVQSNKHLPNIYNALLYILEFCQNDHNNIMISVDPNRIKLEWLQELQSTVILSNLSYPLGNSYYSFANKIDAYIIIRESTTNNRHLKDDFLFLWLFIREVIMPIYVLNIQIDGCRKSENVLREMWQSKITSPYYLCFDADEKIQIYTFNSFIDKASKNWKRFTDGESIGFIPYMRDYTKGDICEDLYFDRLKVVDGNRLTFAIVPSLERLTKYGVTDDVNDWYQTSGPPKTLMKHIMDAVSKALNINYQIYITTSKDSDQYKRTLYYTFMNDVLMNSSADLIMETESMAKMVFIDSIHKNYELTYPLSISEWSIITRHRGYKTPEEKIRDFYGHWTFLFTLFVIFTAFIVIWFAENRRTAFTVFEVLRLLISQGLLTRMNTLSVRIFFSMFLIYFLVIKATFDGHLAKFLTKPELRKQVDTLTDIKDLGYRQYLDHQAYKCVDYILHNDSTVACVNDRVFFYRLFHIHKNLYLGKPFDSTYYQLIGNRMSPFIYRIKKVFILFNDLGFQNLWIDFVTNRTDRYKDKVEETKLYRDFQPITLSSLTFAFVILGIGLVGAVMSFCIEIYLK